MLWDFLWQGFTKNSKNMDYYERYGGKVYA